MTETKLTAAASDHQNSERMFNKYILSLISHSSFFIMDKLFNFDCLRQENGPRKSYFRSCEVGKIVKLSIFKISLSSKWLVKIQIYRIPSGTIHRPLRKDETQFLLWRPARKQFKVLQNPFFVFSTQFKSCGGEEIEMLLMFERRFLDSHFLSGETYHKSWK